MTDTGITEWAQDEFGDAVLGDARRVERLIGLAAGAARRPGGRLTRVFEDAAEREAAFRFIESPHFNHRALLAASHRATARRSAHQEFVFVAADQAAIRVPDSSGLRFGPLSEKSKASGVQVMSALAIAPDGVPLGLVSQEYWTRARDRSPEPQHDTRPIEDRESRFWLSALDKVASLFEEFAPGTVPWFQLDRGADSAALLAKIVKRGVVFTVRACYDRCLAGGGHLYAALAEGEPLGSYRLLVRQRDGQRREARIEVRAKAVTLELKLGLHGRGPIRQVEVWAVEAREIDGGEEPVLWRLLTNRVVASFSDALEVIRGYTMRWRVEDFHLAWKSGTCGIEQSQLRDLEHFAKWATILAAVATRAERLKHLSREQAELPAATEFTRDEIDAVIILRKPKGVVLGAEPTLGDVVRWIADIGGYTGKSSGGPPGIRIISRALVEVEAAAIAVAALRARNGQ